MSCPLVPESPVPVLGSMATDSPWDTVADRLSCSPGRLHWSTSAEHPSLPSPLTSCYPEAPLMAGHILQNTHALFCRSRSNQILDDGKGLDCLFQIRSSALKFCDKRNL